MKSVLPLMDFHSLTDVYAPPMGGARNVALTTAQEIGEDSLSKTLTPVVKLWRVKVSGFDVHWRSACSPPARTTAATYCQCPRTYAQPSSRGCQASGIHVRRPGGGISQWPGSHS